MNGLNKKSSDKTTLEQGALEKVATFILTIRCVPLPVIAIEIEYLTAVTLYQS